MEKSIKRMRQFMLLFILSFSLNVTIKAQSIPFIENGKTWHLREYSPNQWLSRTYYQGPAVEYSLHFGKDKTWQTMDEAEKDTIIMGQAYKRLYRGYGQEMSIAALLREEEGKVYRWDAGVEKEILLYDFTLNEGDIFNMLYPGGGQFTCTVTKVDEYDNAGCRMKRIHFDAQVPIDFAEGSKGDVSRNVWIEGIGVPNGNPLESVDDPMLGGGWACYCPYVYTSTAFYPFSFARQGFRGQELILQEDVTEDVSDQTGQKDNLQYELLKGTGEASDTLHVYGYLWANADCSHYIYCYDDMSGKVLLERVEIGQTPGSHKAYCVDLKFPMFFGDYYHYVVEDSEGQHPVIDPTNSIHAPSISSVKASCIFDLTGRPVSTPSRGIYIRNGKKVLVKRVEP